MWNPSPEGGQCLPGACSRQTRLALANLLFWALLYSILTTYAQSFRTFKRTHAGSSGLSTLLIWYISFMLLIQALTVIGKRIGSLVDEGKRGTFSLYFSNELCCSLFYFVFYRSLFELISSVWEFLLICIVHMLQEWVFYPCRCTSTAFEWYHWLNRKFEGHPTLQWAVVAAFMPPEGKTLRHLEYFVATDKCLRSAAFVFTTVGFIVVLNFMTYGFNQEQYDTRISDMNRLNIFLSVAIVFELFNVALMEILFFRPRRLTVATWYRAEVFAQPGFGLMVFNITSVVLMNVVLDKEVWPY
eukprot:TRINITY_DN1450_c0_g1_i16.p1 TRINITY_DN1450_c0_g1~~TRINITY_DN1450_c0_g1_i16.p1  ORF type:complete len:300 (-),score=44.78 TRINITY_DN1450_c0_g1_i16:21-920(-)